MIILATAQDALSRPGRARWTGLALAGLALALCAGGAGTPAPAAAADERAPSGVMDQVETSYESHTQTAWYFPRFGAWRQEDFRFYPVIGRRDDGSRTLGVRVILKEPPKGDPQTLRAVLGGVTRTSTIDPTRDVRRDTRSCRPTQIIFLREQEDLVRALAGARQAEITLLGYRRPRSHALDPQDLDRFKRFVALYDLDTLPPSQDESSAATLRPGEFFSGGETGVTNPKIIRSSRVSPRFPKSAMGKKVVGRVVLAAIVRKDGTVGDIEVIRAAGWDCGFEQAAIDAVSRWRYEPGLKDGELVDIHFTIVIDFSYEGYHLAPG